MASKFPFQSALITVILGLLSTPLLAQENADPAPVKRPKIHFPQPIFDFGVVKPTEPIKHTFHFTNQGDAPLQINEVRPACGCTTSGEWTRLLQPGETGQIPVQLDPSRFKGKLSKSITILSNDPQQPTSLLQLSGEVWVPIDVTPSFAVFPSLTSRDATAELKVKILSRLENPLEISELNSSTPQFAAKLNPIRPGEEFELVISTVPPLPQDSNRGVVTMKTSSAEMPQLQVQVFANVLPAVQAVPNQIYLPAGKLATATTRFVTLIRNDAEPLKVSEVSSGLENLAPQVQEIQPGKQFRITLNFPAGFEPPQAQPAILSIKTNHPDYPQFNVPIRAIPQPN